MYSIGTITYFQHLGSKHTMNSKNFIITLNKGTLYKGQRPNMGSSLHSLQKTVELALTDPNSAISARAALPQAPQNGRFFHIPPLLLKRKSEIKVQL